MKRILIISLILLAAISCDEPETVVTNYIHPDGTITRRIEMRNIKNKFESLQVPFDTSWVVTDSIEVNEKGDTTWVKRAEKLFKNAEEINSAYRLDSGLNRDVPRHASFEKKFRWFNTEYRFSEQIDKKVNNGFLISDFLNEEELLYFYSPESLRNEYENGPDSVKYKLLKDSVNYKTDIWSYKNFVLASMDKFIDLIGGREGQEFIAGALENNKNEMLDLYKKQGDDLDSLWNNGIVLKDAIGENYAAKYRSEADSAISTVTSDLWLNFKEYSVRIVMPGKLTGTNGFIDKSKMLLWPVRSDYFLSQNYEMWAQSKVPNIWTWIVSGVFLLFVLTGITIRIIKKAE